MHFAPRGDGLHRQPPRPGSPYLNTLPPPPPEFTHRFVLRSGAGFAIFNWIATLASDFLTQAYYGSAFFVGDDVVFNQHWFFTNTLGAIIFFIAFAQMCYHWGVLQWLIAKLGWFFLKTLNVSGAESVVAAASPFIGQGESACMVKPYVNVSSSGNLNVACLS